MLKQNLDLDVFFSHHKGSQNSKWELHNAIVTDITATTTTIITATTTMISSTTSNNYDSPTSPKLLLVLLETNALRHLSSSYIKLRQKEICAHSGFLTG